MKTTYSPQREAAKRRSALTDSLLAVLLAAGLTQIAVCVSATTGLVPPTAQIYSASQAPALENGAPLVRSLTPTTTEKS